MRVFGEQQIRAVVRESDALLSAELAFRAIGEQRATIPVPLALEVGKQGELHVKSAYLHGSPYFVAKAATGFYDNPDRGLPSGSGLVLVFDAQTGFPLALLADNGYLTEVRTAAAGALAARLLGVPGFKRLAVIGAGTQARYQLRAFSSAFSLSSAHVWSRRRAEAAALCTELQNDVAAELVPAASVEDAVRDADVVLTVTPSVQPLVRGGWLAAHATVIAVGSDSPEKRELHDDVFEHAQMIVTDSTAQCARLGELHHAIAGRILSADDVDAEIGEIVVGAKPGRTGDGLVVCDLTGLGAQDAAIAELALVRLEGMADHDPAQPGST